MTAAFRAFFALCLFVLAAPLAADELRPAVVELTEREEGNWLLEWKLPVAASQVRSAAPLAQPVIPSNCRFVSDPVQRAAALALFGRAELQCDGALAGERFGLTELVGNADAIARFVPREQPVQTFRLTAASPGAVILSQPSQGAVLRDYFVIGAEHILFGWDHLLFVIALLLLVREPWPVIKAATAFTIAHSITLVATTLGYAGLPSRPVEALIALSIVFLAVEVAMIVRDPSCETFTRKAPWIVAFGFGLVHGFGFAGALSDIGLPEGEIAIALAAFNIGVEAGQLLIIAAVMALLALVIRVAPKAELPAIQMATYAIGITGSFWLIERLIG